MGKAIAEEMSDLSSGPPMGFMLMVFDFDAKQGKSFNAYFSNAKREDMVKALREQADYLENM
jgi:DNA-directed RNA polymerase specialized sigma subunit